MSPKHIDNVSGDRRAIAPYNFVELPEKVVEAELPLPEGDRYHLNRRTGRIECTLTTESPLYTRCGWSTDDFAEHGEEAFQELPDEIKKKRASFFINPKTKQPTIPGSSIRGMLRTLVEIVSFSKIDRVSDEQRLFFRAVASNPNKESWGKKYKNHVEPEKVKAGYLKKDNQGWYIQPAQTEKGKTFAWVRETSISLQDFKQFNHNNYHPQYIPVSYETVDVDRNDKPKRFFAHNVESPEIYPTSKGVLVTSGNMKQKEDTSSPRCNHCVVFAEYTKAERLRIDDIAIAHYRNALTDFQKESPFDKDWGLLKLEAEKDRPVFYSDPGDDKIVRFFGQSPNFRIPYSPEGNGHATTVVDFIPENLKNLATIDLADAIFGWVKQESKEQKLPKNFEKQRAGRLFITDALCQSNPNSIWYEDNPLTPQILSEPKPSYFPHYLVQLNVDKSELKHYASPPVTETVIRGHKLYWHKGSEPDIKHPNPEDPKIQSQITKIKPIKKGVIFKFDIHFENLSNVELGAVLWVLSLSSDKSQTLETGKEGEKYCFSLGMGKPLGMGAVKIDYELHLSDRTSRYSNLFNGTEWKTVEQDQSQTPEKEEESVKAFEKYILDWICCQDYPKDCKREQLQHLKQLPRIEMLLAMLRSDRTPDLDKTRYMEIECDPSQKQCIGKPKKDEKVNEYSHRPVLPTPLEVMKIPDRRRFPPVNSPVQGITESKFTEKPKLKKQSNLSKPKLKKNYERGQDEGAGNINPFARPQKPRKS